MKYFRAPQNSLGNLDAETAGIVIAAAADLALIVDQSGAVRDLAFHNEELAEELIGHTDWIGRPWSSAVTVESRPKLELLRRDAAAGIRKWRHVNYVLTNGAEVPITFSTVQLADGRLVAFGRDLRAMSALQQRLVNAQQSMERDYSRIRHVETRYRMLLQTASDAVMILDAGSQAVTEANPAAAALVAGGLKRGAIPALADIFAPAAIPSIRALLATVRASGRADDVRASLVGGEEVLASALMFREEDSAFFLLRIARAKPAEDPSGLPKSKTKLLKVVESAPDGFVVTDHDQRVISANAAFLAMAQLASEDQARGEPLSRWVGRQGVEMDVLSANLAQRGSVRLFATVLMGEFGTASEIEISAVTVMNGGQPCYGFAIRNVGRRLPAEPRTEGRFWPRSGEQLSDLIGRVALKELVRESTDVIERMCIETALEMTNDNRASAAEMLGLSRQSLYVKLRRYGLGDLAGDGAGEGAA